MYDYKEAVKEDVKNYIRENYSADEIRENLETIAARSDFEDKLNDILWIEDSVTGNASCSYTFNTWQAEENLCHNMDLLQEACRNIWEDLGDFVERGAEFCDVTIRCYLLSGAISEVLDEFEDEVEEENKKADRGHKRGQRS